LAGTMPDEEMRECQSGVWRKKDFIRCGAPASVTHSITMQGADIDGEEAVFEVVRIQCAAGHMYDELKSVVK